VSRGEPADSGRLAATPPRRYATTAAFEAALKARLLARVTPRRTMQDLRKLLAFDRVLARLSHVAPDAWLLKGGVALEYSLQQARATTDIDISVRVDLETMTETLQAAAAVQLHDYFTIRLGERTKPAEGVDSYRFHVTVLYENGRVFEEVKIDVGFADPWLGKARTLTAEPLLDFAGIEPVTVRAIPAEQHLAEKVHAYTRRYGHGESSRVKDLVDMALLVQEPLDPDFLVRSLEDVFRERETHELPVALPRPPARWDAVYARLAKSLPIPPTSSEAHLRVADALARALARARAGATA